MRTNRHTGRRIAVFFLFALLCVSINARGGFAQEIMPVPYHHPPQEMTFCGEKVPLDHPEVWERFDREFTILVYAHAQIYLWLKRAARHFPEFEAELHRRGMPEDIKYMAVAESDLLPNARSPAGAVGPWQFMAGTGRNYGLRLNRYVDERRDFDKATEGALHYLEDLHDRFGSWALAAAGYNCGEYRVQKEIERQKVKDYYLMELPSETERYVFRILAIKAILSDPERYGYRMPPWAAYPDFDARQVKVRVRHYLPLQPVAETAGITYREFKSLNPAFRSNVMPPGTYEVRVPEKAAADFEEKLARLERKLSPKVRHHKVRRGDTLLGIAGRYGVSVRELREWNGIRGSKILVGQTLTIRR